ncbi:hypothetical protein [Candidatus Vondammii sp. HM_W22]|uniref:hypothetical protein n=1 Tax=Candidatus Vondammii sp. HM_W22 TaxID=2687299 RepID=UPI001F13183F|nr:hypothetical protein [Candidatus Vondammii sp. HM_W22]
MRPPAVRPPEGIFRKLVREKENRASFFVSGLVLLQLIVAGPLTANTTSDYAAQRNQLLAAEKAFFQSNAKRYKQLKFQLVDYPLYPYLKKQLSIQTRLQVEAFLALHEKAPIA